jgi:hypothetical protein
MNHEMIVLHIFHASNVNSSMGLGEEREASVKLLVKDDLESP